MNAAGDTIIAGEVINEAAFYGLISVAGREISACQYFLWSADETVRVRNRCPDRVGHLCPRRRDGIGVTGKTPAGGTIGSSAVYS